MINLNTYDLMLSFGLIEHVICNGYSSVKYLYNLIK